MRNLKVFSKRENIDYIAYLKSVIDLDIRLKEFELTLNEINSYIEHHTDEYISKELGILANLIIVKIISFPDTENFNYKL